MDSCELTDDDVLLAELELMDSQELMDGLDAIEVEVSNS